MEQDDLLAIGSPWLTPPDAARYVGVALGTMRNWTSGGRIPYVRRGRVVRYHRDELDAWLRGGECHLQGTSASRRSGM